MAMRSQFGHNQQEAARRSRERREREDAAGRLHDLIPGLSSLALELREERGGDLVVKYVRHVVLERAPALFDIPCSDPACKDGGHDVTAPILRALRAATPRFEGEHSCEGNVGRGECRRVLHYVGIAVFTS